MSSSNTPFARVLKTAFPNHPRLPDRCAIRLGIEANQPDYSEVIEVVDRNGGLDDLLSRLRDTHPGDRAHLEEFDRQLWTVMNEAAAFDWAVMDGFSGVAFTDDNATTDVSADEGVMIEAKTIHVSPEERQIKEKMAEASDRGQLLMRMSNSATAPHRNLLKKFEDGLQDSVQKLRRQDGNELVVYFRLDGIDIGTSEREALNEIKKWAFEAADRTGLRIVVWKGGERRNPFIDIGG